MKAYFVIPSTIYGFASGKLVDLGVQNTRSMQIPWTVSRSIARKRGGYVGQGLNVWPNVHVDDSVFHVCSVTGNRQGSLVRRRSAVADLYIVLYDAILEGKAGHGREGFYFGENGHYLFKDVSAKIGEALYDLGKSDTPEASAFTEEDYKQFPLVCIRG